MHATSVQWNSKPCYPFHTVIYRQGGGPRVVVSTAAFHARVPGSVPGLGGLIETKMFLPHPRVKVSIVGSLRDREVACSASDRQGSNFESCVWRTVSSHSSHLPQEVLLAQFSLYVHKGGLKPDSFHFISYTDRPRRSVLRCSVIFYIRHDFDGNGSAQSIFAPMFCHSDVRLRHQISGTKGLNHWVSVQLFCHSMSR